MILTFSESERNKKLCLGLVFVLISMIVGLWTSDVLQQLHLIMVTGFIVLVFVYIEYKLLYYKPYNKDLTISKGGIDINYLGGESKHYKPTQVKMILVRRRPLLSSPLRSSRLLRVHLKTDEVIDFSILQFTKEDMNQISEWNYTTKMY